MKTECTLVPKNVDYFLTYDVPQIEDAPPIPAGTVVYDVELLRPEGWDVLLGTPRIRFTVRGTGRQHITHYNWALAEDTLENRKLFGEVEEQMMLRKRHEALAAELRGRLVTLKPRVDR